MKSWAANPMWSCLTTCHWTNCGKPCGGAMRRLPPPNWKRPAAYISAAFARLLRQAWNVSASDHSPTRPAPSTSGWIGTRRDSRQPRRWGQAGLEDTGAFPSEANIRRFVALCATGSASVVGLFSEFIRPNQTSAYTGRASGTQVRGGGGCRREGRAPKVSVRPDRPFRIRSKLALAEVFPGHASRHQRQPFEIETGEAAFVVPADSRGAAAGYILIDGQRASPAQSALGSFFLVPRIVLVLPRVLTGLALGVHQPPAYFREIVEIILATLLEQLGGPVQSSRPTYSISGTSRGWTNRQLRQSTPSSGMAAVGRSRMSSRTSPLSSDAVTFIRLTRITSSTATADSVASTSRSVVARNPCRQISQNGSP